MKIAQNAIENPLLDGLDLTGTEFISNLISSIISLLFVGGVVIFVLILIIASINWITSGGDKAKAAAAREKMFNAFIGIFILFIIFAIIQIVGLIFNIDLLSIDLSVLQLGYTPDPGSCSPPNGNWCTQEWCCEETSPCNWNCFCALACPI